MRKLLISLAGFALLAALVAAAAAAHRGPHAGALRLSILHVPNGCHTWFDGRRIAPTLRLSFKPGQRLAIVNNDTDAHRLVQVAGPRLALQHPMMRMLTGTTSVVFRKAGTYRLTTRAMDAEPKANRLLLIVKVR